MAVIAAAAIAAGAAIYSSSQSASSSKAASDAQKEAAQLQTQVARELHEHWKQYYMQCDAAAIAEVCAQPKYVPQYALWEGRSRLEVLRTFARARVQLRQSQDIYCMGRAAQQCNYIAGIEAVALVDSVNFGYRFEESQRIQLDALRLQTLYNWLGLGRNLLNQSTAASSLASSAAFRLGAQAGQASNGWLQAAGWLTGEAGQRLIGQIGARLGMGVAQTEAEQRASAARDYAYEDIATPPTESANAGIAEQQTATVAATTGDTGGTQFWGVGGAPY